MGFLFLKCFTKGSRIIGLNQKRSDKLEKIGCFRTNVPPSLTQIGNMMKKKSTAITRRAAVDKKNSPIRDALRPEFYESIAKVLRTARVRAYRVVNFTMVEAYWNVGRMIVEEEQKGKKRAEYGTFLIKNLAVQLTAEFGNGFTERNLLNFRQFFLCFPIVNAVRSQSPEIHKTEILPDNPNLIRNALRSKSPETHKTDLMQDNSNSIWYALRTELTWIHYRLLIRVENPKGSGMVYERNRRSELEYPWSGKTDQLLTDQIDHMTK